MATVKQIYLRNLVHKFNNSAYLDSPFACFRDMPTDGRRWTTQEQLEWLQQRHPDYLEAQAEGRYDRFWPQLYQEWFTQFPAREPTSNDPTDSEPEAESDCDSNLQDTAATNPSSSLKRKNTATGKVPKKRKKKIVSTH